MQRSESLAAIFGRVYRFDKVTVMDTEVKIMLERTYQVVTCTYTKIDIDVKK